MASSVVNDPKTKKQAPKCQLCLENDMDFVGQMNGLDIYTCPKCDRVNAGRR